jgi:hypothetical protein
LPPPPAVIQIGAKTERNKGGCHKEVTGEEEMEGGGKGRDAQAEAQTAAAAVASGSNMGGERQEEEEIRFVDCFFFFCLDALVGSGEAS